MNLRRGMIVLLVAAVVGAGALTGTAAPQPYYAGKTIEIIIPFAAGGGSDLHARFTAPFWREHIPGKPTILVRNMPGGGSLLGANWFAANARLDGLMLLGTSASTIFPVILGQRGVRFDPREWVAVLGAPVGGAVYISPAAGVTRPEDLRRPRQPLVYAGISATGLDLVPLLAFELLGLEYKPVLGYEGRGPARIAFERGESNLDYQTTPAYLTQVLPLIQERKAVPLFSFGMIDERGNLVRDPVLKDMPSVLEVYRAMHGRAPSGPVWEAYKAFVSAGFAVQKIFWIRNGSPFEAISALRTGTRGLKEDRKYFADGKDVLGGYPVLTAEETTVAAKAMLEISEDVRKWVREYMTRKFDVRFD